MNQAPIGTSKRKHPAASIHRMQRLALFILFIVAVIVALNIFYNIYMRQIEEEALVLQQARVITGLIEATQELISQKQDLINRSHDGHFEFKGLNPEKFSREASAIFNRSSDHQLKLTNVHPRNPANVPDAIEKPILERMNRDATLREHFGLAESSGHYYYIKRLDIKAGCLPCHGEPRGTADITGYRREGLAIGDFGGAISVRIPAAGLLQTSRQRIWLQLAFALILSAGAIFLTSYLLRRMTRLSVDLSRANLNLETQNSRMTALEKQKGDLFHMLIHDMKAPLSFMIGSLQMLQEQKVGPLNAEQEDLAALVLRGCHRLENIISNLLDINRLEEGKLELRDDEVDLQQLMTDRTRPWLQQARRQRKKFEVRSTTRHALLHCDRNMLDRIIENLISNAFKHTREGSGEILLELADWTTPEGVLFRLSDNGEGIPAEFTDRIFEKYSVVQGQELGLKTDTGLGLAFCRLAVQAMGGNIWVESTAGQGTSFFFNLPLSR